MLTRMKLTAKIKLQATDTQKDILLKTLETGNAACNYMSEVAWQSKEFNQYRLHNLVYYEAKDKFSIGSQLTIRCIAKVTDSYKKDRRTQRFFKKHGAIPYDDKMLRYELNKRVVSIWTVEGRQEIPFTAGTYTMQMLESQQGESKLILQRGKFYLLATCDREEAVEQAVEGYLGVDLGIANIAVDSDEDFYSGSHINRVRHRQQSHRKKLQVNGSRSAKRKLKRWSGKEKRFAKDVNHCISKNIVSHAKCTKQAIVLEDLAGIRERAKALGRAMRYRLHRWAFYDLQQKIMYKAKLAGVPVIFVDPAYTSQRCSKCGHIDRANRKTQAKFECQSCGHASHADYNAACNIAQAGAHSTVQ